MAPLSCERCGACCANLPSNEAEGFVDWVEIEDTAPLLRRPDLVRKLVRRDAAGVPHLRLVTSPGAPSACAALRGALGRRVSCSIYHLRPRPCRTVQPGDGSCLEARRQHGLDEA
ncbi:MAG: YkgJ family cysteine cluster protein [Myxococcales bacterium]|nr:YkgJ family cysteine cluster protein [Myxococcales bacterium]